MTRRRTLGRWPLVPGVAGVVAACGVGFAACDGDQPWPSLHDGDLVTMTPTVITLLSTDVAMAIGTNGPPSQRSVTVYVEAGADDANMHAEGKHIDVRLGNNCFRDQVGTTASAGGGAASTTSSGAGGAGGTTSSTTTSTGSAASAASASGGSSDTPDYTQFVHFVANPNGAADAPCRQVSDAQVHCILTVNGTATFTIAATNVAYFGGRIPISACRDSGSSSSKPAATASVFVGRPIPATAKLEMAKDLTVESVPIACGAEKLACNADALRRRRRTTVSVTGVTGPTDGADQSAFGGVAADVDVSIHTRTSTTNGVAWLSTSETCEPVASFNHLHLATDPSSGTADFVVCADGRDGDYTVHAIANRFDVGGKAANAKTTQSVHVDPQPALLERRETGCTATSTASSSTGSSSSSGGGSGGSGGSDASADAASDAKEVSLRMVDCESKGIPSLHVKVSGGGTAKDVTLSGDPTCTGVFTNDAVEVSPICTSPLALTKKE